MTYFLALFVVGPASKWPANFSTLGTAPTGCLHFSTLWPIDGARANSAPLTVRRGGGAEEESFRHNKRRAVMNLRAISHSLLPFICFCFSGISQWDYNRNLLCVKLQLEQHGGRLPTVQPCDSELGCSAGAIINTHITGLTPERPDLEFENPLFPNHTLLTQLGQ